MQRSTSRILTTHTGSLPRPRELTRLYAQRAAGAPADDAEIARAGRDAVRRIVDKQREAGIDVGNNGEQQRDSFFLYLKDRLSGLGGSWQRPSRADVDRYPEFKRMWTEQHAARTQVSALGGLPKAIGEVKYLDAAAIADECRHFRNVLAETPGVFVEPFMSAPSPGIVAMAVLQGRACCRICRLCRRGRSDHQPRGPGYPARAGASACMLGQFGIAT